jgi:hypothetical protein
MNRALVAALVLELAACDAAAQASAPERYQNPIDGHTYLAPDGWQAWEPSDAGVPDVAGRVRVEGVRLLCRQSRFEAQVGAAALARRVRQVVRHAREIFATAGQSEVLVQVDTSPARKRVRIVSRGEVARELLQRFYDRVRALPRLPVRSGDLSYQVYLSVAP